MRILRWLGIALVALVVVLVAVLVGIGVVARFSDGPIGLFPGGPLRSGAFVSEPVDWSRVGGERAPLLVELELVEPPGSRIIGAVVYEGQLFAICDLGFIARRAPTPLGRLIPIYRFKRWHEHAERDGRVVVRIAGKRYERQAVRVTDSELLAALRSITEELASQFFASPLLDTLMDPDDIWFFRMDPRPPRQTAREVGLGSS